MSPKQKKKYFDKINNKFKKELSKQPQRKSKNKKKIIFKPSFDVKGFNQHQKVIAIRKKQEIHQCYQQDIHFS